MAEYRVTLERLVDSLPDAAEVLSRETMRPAGEWQEREVPDTLDLAARAELAVNVLSRNFKPKYHYCIPQTFRFDAGTTLEDLFDNGSAANWSVSIKYIRTLPLMRTMCGSELGMDIEYEAMQHLLGQIREDGLLYAPITVDGPAAGTCYPSEVGIGTLALLSWYGRDRNPQWLHWLRVLCGGLTAASIRVGDYAYIPPESALGSDGNWVRNPRGAGELPPGYIQYYPPEEPVHDWQGCEGAVKYDQSKVLEALVCCHELLGDEGALEQARRLSRFCQKPTLWQDTSDDGYPGHEHGIFEGHFHGNVSALQSLLRLGVIDHDDYLKQLVREAYDHARRHGVIRLGFVPGWLRTEAHGRPHWLGVTSEGCGVADFTILAILLSDAGLGNHWDDVDYLVRNHLTELQMTNIDLLRRASGQGPEYDEVLQLFVGGFSQTYLTANTHSAVHGCCTSNGNLSLYYVWEGITRFDGGVATVNLFLNRSSTWMDIDSYLPYEGRVLLRNKEAHTAMVRVPSWLNAVEMKFSVNDQRVDIARSGNYAVIGNLQPRDTIRIEFPVPESTDQYTIGDTTYTATFRGSTVVDISPRKTEEPEHRDKYPFFVRDHMRATTAPLRTVRQFVPKHLIPTY